MTETAPNATTVGTSEKPIRVLTCWSGALVSGSLAILMYRLTTAIAATFAQQSLHSDNMTVYRITIALRTLIVGISALGTFIFGFVGIGLLALGVQRLTQQLFQPKSATAISDVDAASSDSQS